MVDHHNSAQQPVAALPITSTNHSSTQRQIKTCDFNPFEFTRIYYKIREKHTAWLLLSGLSFVVLIVLGAASDGNIGTWRDFQLWTDIQRIFGATDLPPAQPSFPLMRDVTTWLLSLSVISGAMLLHRQWQYMSKCLSELANNGAIVARAGEDPNEDKSKSNVFSKFLRIDSIVAGTPEHEKLNVFVYRVTTVLAKHKMRLLVPMSVASLVLACLLVLGEENSLFQPLSPPGLPPEAKAQWLQEVYRNWWAGRSHVTAWILYLVLATFAIFLILTFQVIGILAIYVTIGMYFLIEPSADWLNRDGRYGWAPVAKCYRTVVWANALLGVTLTVVLASLGVTNFGWVAALVVIYVLLMPVFTLVPWAVFRRVEESAQKLRVKEIESLIKAQKINIYRDIERMAPFLAEIDRCRAARIRPLRLGTVSLFTHLTLILLPAVLAAAQIFFPLHFGSK